ncbi:vacuolar ATP synthase, partial [Copromyces sp. CBS 386.78]
PFFGALGCAIAIIFAVIGASYGTAKSSGAIFATGILKPEQVPQNILPTIMAQILSIYGLVTSILISNALIDPLPLYVSFLQLGAGLAVGLTGLAAGFAIGIVGDAGVRANTQQPRLYTGMVLILIFSEVLGLYGVIVGILMLTRSRTGVEACY